MEFEYTDEERNEKIRETMIKLVDIWIEMRDLKLNEGDITALNNMFYNFINAIIEETLQAITQQ